MDIRKLALAEKAAEATRKSAEEQWRRTWWATTMALGKLTGIARGEGVTVVEQATGQSRGYVLGRSKTGAALQGFSQRAVAVLPPRMTMELVRQKVEITPQVIHDLLQAEQEGKSLRQFSAELTGKAWADTPEGASEETINQIVASQPELVGRLVAQHDAASRAHDSEVLSHSASREHVRPADWNSSEHVLTRLTLAVKQLRQQCEQPGDLTENARLTIDWALAELSAIKEGRDFVGEIEAWLEGSTA